MVQEAYLRWEQAAASEVRSPKSFLATIVTRLCLNRLALAQVRLEHEIDPLQDLRSKAFGSAEHVDARRDAVSEAFMIVLGQLSPAERVVFLLREAFDFEYADIGLILERSPENCRQILKRARERLAARETTAPPDREQNRRVASEFINAAESGAFDGLLRLLSDGAALAPAPRDLSEPAPPLVHDRKILFEMLRDALAQMRGVSEDLFVCRVGDDYACVSGGGTPGQEVVLRIVGPKVAAVRLVKCPVLLQELEVLMTIMPGGSGQQDDTTAGDG